jgi:hypothetical protein
LTHDCSVCARQNASTLEGAMAEAPHTGRYPEPPPPPDPAPLPPPSLPLAPAPPPPPLPPPAPALYSAAAPASPW